MKIGLVRQCLINARCETLNTIYKQVSGFSSQYSSKMKYLITICSLLIFAEVIVNFIVFLNYGYSLFHSWLKLISDPLWRMVLKIILCKTLYCTDLFEICTKGSAVWPIQILYKFRSIQGQNPWSVHQNAESWH